MKQSTKILLQCVLAFILAVVFIGVGSEKNINLLLVLSGSMSTLAGWLFVEWGNARGREK